MTWNICADFWQTVATPIPMAGFFQASGVKGPRQYANIMTKKVQPKAEALGLPHVTWRLVRHWHATLLGDSRVPVEAAQERMGHSRAETTMKYYAHVTSFADQAVQTVSSALKKAVED